MWWNAVSRILYILCQSPLEIYMQPHIFYLIPFAILSETTTKDSKSYYKTKCLFLFDLYHLFQSRFLNKSSVEEIETVSRILYILCQSLEIYMQPHIFYLIPFAILSETTTKDSKSYYKTKCLFLFDLYHLFQSRFLNKSSVEEIEEMSGENIWSL